VLLVVGAAILLSACGEQEPATTAQVHEARADADPASPRLATGGAGRRDRGNRSSQARGDDAGQRAGKRRRVAPGGDGRTSAGGGNPAPDGTGSSKPQADSISDELKANVQELLEGGRPANGDSGLQIPPGLLDQGDRATNPLDDLCLDPDKCPGVREPGD
jgi:hypothetical protein